jgi:hypothetical protein
MQHIVIITFLLLTPFSLAEEKNAEFHLKQIERFEAYMNDPKNYKTSKGLSYTSGHPTINKEEHLKALVKLGAITQKEFKFQNLKNTRANTLKWMKFASGRKDILEASAESEKPGTTILKFHLWYLPSAKKSVEQFAKELKQQS